MMSKLPKIPDRLGLLAALMVLFVTLQSCLLYPLVGPGYWVSIEVRDPIFKKENTAQFEEIAVRGRFVKSRSEEEADWYYIYYHASNEEYRRLQIWISYHRKEESLRVVVMNDWTGQKMKEEIDRVADLYIATMSQAYGKENLRVVRQRTGPPM